MTRPCRFKTSRSGSSESRWVSNAAENDKLETEAQVLHSCPKFVTSAVNVGKVTCTVTAVATRYAGFVDVAPRAVVALIMILKQALS